MEEWIRKYNYISDYYDTVYKLYSTTYPAYPVTYYQLDFDESIQDKETLMGGSYEKLGIGDLSGVKWRKILLLPVGNVEAVVPSQDASERGVTFDESESSSMTIPTDYGILPNENDVVNFSQEFMMNSLDIGPLFVVSNVNMATYGDITIYQCQLKIAPFDQTQIDNQISTYHMFLESTKRIHPIENAELILKLQNRDITISEWCNDLYNNVSGFYLVNLN